MTPHVWTEATGQPRWAEQLQPRRGHLLELDAPEDMAQLSRGVMEMAYTKVRMRVWKPCHVWHCLNLALLPGMSVS